MVQCVYVVSYMYLTTAQKTQPMHKKLRHVPKGWSLGRGLLPAPYQVLTWSI